MLGYTLHQFRTYVRLCQQRRAEQLRDLLWACHVAQGDPKKVREVLRQLDKAA